MQLIKKNVETKEKNILDLLEGMLLYDLDKRLTLKQCLTLL